MKQDDMPTVAARVDGYTRVCLTAIALLLAVLVVGLWAERAPTVPDAHAGKLWLDSSKQRDALVDGQTQTNRKLDQIISLLKSGEVTVQIKGFDPSQPGAGGGDVKSAKRK